MIDIYLASIKTKYKHIFMAITLNHFLQRPTFYVHELRSPESGMLDVNDSTKFMFQIVLLVFEHFKFMGLVVVYIFHAELWSDFSVWVINWLIRHKNLIDTHLMTCWLNSAIAVCDRIQKVCMMKILLVPFRTMWNGKYARMVDETMC